MTNHKSEPAFRDPMAARIKRLTKDSNTITSPDIEAENDFFEFDVQTATPAPQPHEAQICVRLADKFFSNTKQKSRLTDSPPVSDKKSELTALQFRQQLARWALALFTVLMFIIVIKLFLQLGDSSVSTSGNHVRHSGRHHHHRSHVIH